MLTPSILMPAAAAAIAILCALGGMAVAGGRRARILVPLSGGLLVAAAIFGLLPEIANESGWPLTLGLAATGCAVLAVLDRRGYSVCPGCSHAGEFAGSLVLAISIHAFFDGWGMVTARNHGMVSAAIVAAMLLHKIPEGFALGTMLGASARGRAAGLAVVAEAPTIVGGAIGLWFTPLEWVNYPLALVAGSFLFLGLHAMAPQRRIAPR